MSRLPYGNLTTREKDVLRLILAGKTAKEAGEILGISQKQVNARLETARQKMLTNKSLEAAYRAKQDGQI